MTTQTRLEKFFQPIRKRRAVALQRRLAREQELEGKREILQRKRRLVGCTLLYYLNQVVYAFTNDVSSPTNRL